MRILKDSTPLRRGSAVHLLCWAYWLTPLSNPHILKNKNKKSK